ncbi:MAG TPA: hypothetical protein VLA32_07685 [Anaerolineales bacterium]|jgi:hypothetical protein|nr:hypothetical protein [Anaerolineales bacterium]
MTTADLNARPSEDQMTIQSYPPSWYNRMLAWVGRLPVPGWLVFVLFGGIVVLIEWLLVKLDQPGQPVVLDPEIFLSIFQLVYVIIFIKVLDDQAGRVLEKIRPTLRLDDRQFADLRARFTTMPKTALRNLTWVMVPILGVMGAFLIMMGQAGSENLAVNMPLFSQSMAGYFALLIFGLMWLNNLIFLFHTVHQLRAISFSYAHVTEVNLFHQSDLYAFSSLAASTAIGLSLSTPIWLLMDNGPINLAITSVFALFSVVIFVWPLLGAHRILRDQKEQMLRQSDQKKEQLIQELFARLERQDLNGIEELEKAFSSMEKGQAMLQAVSTWPWQTGTLRQIAGAILLPITIWVIQYFLNQVLST